MSLSRIARRRFGAVAVATAALLVATPADATTNLNLLVSWSQGSIRTIEASLQILNEELKARSNGEIQLNRRGPEVVPPFEQLEPVSAGTFHMLYTHPAYHGGATGIGMMIDTVNPDPDRRRESGVWDWVDRYYQEHHNLKIIAITATTGFHLLLKEPLDESGNLKGRKIRSNPAYDALIETLGGAPVTLPVPQIYTALQKGLVDGTAFPVHSMVGPKYYEVVKYMVRPSFGRSTNLWMMNLDHWRRLDSAAQNTLLEVGKVVEKAVPWEAQRIRLDEEQGMIMNGVRFTFLKAEQARQIELLFNEGLWKRGEAVSGASAREFVALVKETDMAAK